MTSELRRQQLHGWFSSLVLHSLLLLAVFPLFRLSPLAVPKKLFHWDIALVQSTPLADKPAQNSSAPEPTISRPTERTPRQARAVAPSIVPFHRLTLSYQSNRRLQNQLCQHLNQALRHPLSHQESHPQRRLLKSRQLTLHR